MSNSNVMEDGFVDSVLDRYDPENFLKIENNFNDGLKDELCLFISFDICNSTELKLNNNNWFAIVDVLRKEKFSGLDISFWKFNGDEVIYKRTVGSLEYICKILNKVYDFLDTLSQKMSDKEKDINNYVKATVWLARIGKDHENTEKKIFFMILMAFQSTLVLILTKVLDLQSVHLLREWLLIQKLFTLCL